MARKKTGETSGAGTEKGQEATAPGGRVKRNHVKITHMFTREQAEALRDEAYRRAQARGSRKPDESEIVREAVDAWIAKHARR